MNGRKKAVFLAVVLIIASVAVLHPIQMGFSELVETHYPSAYNLLGATAYVSGALTDLQSDNSVYMTFRSYGTAASAQTLYAHQETATIAGTTYYLQNLVSADAAGTNLSVSMASVGRQLWGKFVYPLTGVTSIPAGTWTVYYRTWYSSGSPEFSTNSPSSVPAGTWTNSTNAFTSDNLYASTATNGATQEYGDYGFSIPSGANITKVEVGFEAYTDQNEKIGITLSWDGGSTWATEFVSSPLGTTDPDTVTWVDFTAATNWTVDTLSNTNFRTRANGIKTGGMTTIYLDWIPVRVTYAMLPSAHADVDILIRKSDGTIRQTIATDVATSGALSETVQTLSGIYSWSAYSVVDQSDYLEIDYYVDVTTAKSDVTAYLTIDDNTLASADQTRATNIMLPSEYTMEVEFTGLSNTQDWAQLVWTIDSAWTTGNVSTTLQLYNYTLGDYPTSGDGYITYTSNATPNVDETKNQTITTNPTDFRNATGNWKIKVKGVKSTTSQFGFKADLIKYEVTAVPPPDVAVLSVAPSPTTVYPGETVNITVIVENQGGATATFNVTTYYNSTSIETQNVTDLASSANTTLLFTWDTTGVAEGNYTIKAEASVVLGETDTADNTLIDGIVTITAVVHDVAVIGVTPSLTKVNPNQMVNITVVAENQGTEPETFNVTAYYDSVPIQTQTVTGLAGGANTTLTFSWNTTGVAESVYTIKAVADTVSGETDTADNTFIDDTITVVKPTVDVSPASIIGPPPNITETFSVNITVSDVVDLYSWQVGMTFNATVLEALSFVEGPFLQQGGTTIMVNGTIDNAAGIIYYHSSSLTGPVPGVTGNGTLAIVTFRVKAYGNSTLFLTDVILLDSNLAEIPTNITDGYFRLPQPPVASFTYSPLTPFTGETVTFNATASFDLDGAIVSYVWDFGDNTTGTGNIATHSYADNGTYTVTLTVTDNDGLNGTDSQSITVLNSPPVAIFTESAETVPTGELIYFNASQSYDPDGFIMSYFWDFGDGSNATGVIVDHAYVDNGTYTVTLTVTDDDGATASANATKNVSNRPPVASFTESAETVYTSETITFNATASYDPDGSVVGYFWDFGDGINATGIVVSHAYSDNGTYTVTLTVTDDDGASNSTSSIKTILNRSPVALFTENATTVLTGEVIEFNATTSYDPDGSIVSYFWDFGDGTNATGVIVDHTYANNGTYIVTLTVTDNDGASASTNATKTVLNRSPVASFTESAESVSTGEPITFNATASYDPDGTIVSYFWDFGDGSNATGVIVSHAYADNGTYTVTLTVTDDDGANSTATSTKTVGNRPPIASFTESAETVLTGELINFNASQSSDPDGFIVSYFWDFGDGTNATGVTVDHAYVDNGAYTVTLTVTDDDGATASVNATKTVLNRFPVASFTESAETVFTGEVITFNASSSSDPDGFIVSYFWDFGDGTNASGVTTSHSYADNGTYTVTLTVTDDDGASNSTSSIKTILNRSPVALFTENATTVLTGEVIRFNASQSYDPDGSVISYFWDFGDGSNATSVIVDHAYDDNGTYTVTLTVTDNDGASASTNATKTVLNRSPVASFTESAESVSTGEPITFNASASYDPDGSVVSYFWDFGDGTNTTGIIVSHAYADNGTYTVTLTVTDDDGANSTATSTKTVGNRPPVASFTESAETVYTGETITFNASASSDPDGTIVSYFWDFGDGSNATGVTVGHSYADNGTYTVTLTVTDDDGATASTSSTKTILNTPPVASFTESAETVLTGQVITFNASNSYDPDGFIVSYFWDFGDGTNATGVVVSHAYSEDGIYTVTLTVTDDDGASSSASSTKTILNRPPVASFTESATTVFTSEVIQFNASTSSDPDGFIVSYFWDFGDGTNATGVTVSHAYADGGTYTVTLTVTDNDGATSSASAIKTVLNRPPTALFTENATMVLTDEVIQFNASQSFDPDGFIVSYFWDFGDGTNTTGVTVDHAYSDNGTYTVTLTVTDDDGATSTSTSTKTVLNRPPIAAFTENATIVLTGEIIEFNATTSYDPDGSIVSYSWDFGDGTNATSVIVNHAYSDDGTYTVTLTVTDDDGASASVNATKTVLNRPPVALFTENATIVLTDEVIRFNASQSYDPDGSVVSYFWDFGDGTNTTDVIVDHAYADNGTYTVTLTVTDDDGASNSASATKTVLNRPPVALFSYSPLVPFINETITFNASASYDPDGFITSYFWDFGDGINATGVIINYTYTEAGTYTVTLTVTDDDGQTDTATDAVTVYSALHDVAVVSVVPSDTEAYPTWVVPINITVVVRNEGNITETFNVTAYYNETAIETKSVTLAAGANTTLIFSWNLTGLSSGNYTIKAEASVLPGEIDTADNTLTSGITVKLKQPGDANDDGLLNVYDTGILGKAWGTIVGDPDYDPRADFNGDGIIDDSDLQILQLYWP